MLDGFDYLFFYYSSNWSITVNAGVGLANQVHRQGEGVGTRHGGRENLDGGGEEYARLCVTAVVEKKVKTLYLKEKNVYLGYIFKHFDGKRNKNPINLCFS